MNRLLTSLVATAMLTACANYGMQSASDRAIAQPSPQQALVEMRATLAANPLDIDTRTAYNVMLNNYTNRLLNEAATALQSGDTDTATARYEQVLSWDAQNSRALEGLRLSSMGRRHEMMLRFATSIQDSQPEQALRILRDLLNENPRNMLAIQLRTTIEGRLTRDVNLRPSISAEMKKTVAMQFRDMPIVNMVDFISRITGVNFIFDRDVQKAATTTIFARSTTAEDALNLVLLTNQLDKKVLNDNTILIYPRRPDKDRDYKDLVMRTFYLNNADPKQVVAMIKQMTKTKDVYIDERLGMLVMRDTPEVIAVVERLITAQDLPQSEVQFDAMVLEVNGSDILNLGIRYPDTIGFTAGGITENGLFTPGQISLRQLSQMNKSNVLVNLGDPTISVNLAHSTTFGNILSNPNIRVKNREKAKILIGDRLPVVTTTNSNGVVSETINYQDVGLTLNVEPTIGQDGSVGVKIQLEVSNVTSTIRTQTGLLAYQIGTRRAETNMNVNDGQTQVLAGLLSRTEQRNTQAIPGIGDLPVLDRIFGNKGDTANKTELVLLITPHIVRNTPIPGSDITNFASGTEGSISMTPTMLRTQGALSVTGSPGGAPGQPPPQMPPPQAQPPGPPPQGSPGRR
ncbi:secretin N-terminal domain-containing protein [Variovorax rhizosphaerae]|uniref:Secretin N-terminal domain-containing protein n=1 Tax=Variovorax rhizosphaerae TaxID=1836200 RepID=A0ABU8WVS0_9BURK